ncbi:MAG: adenylate kinase family protein [Methanosarcinaceae archaeon]|nr:adenylate kinase family protein [Methanosarcinaceae archaeon]
MLIGLTGTPGTGKTSVSRRLGAESGYRVIHLNDLIKEEHLYSEVDEIRGSVIADMDRVADRISELVDDPDEMTILDSHLSHHIADTVIVLRTAPGELKRRLELRGYNEDKIRENVEAECLDVILVESVEWCKNIFEVGNTRRPVEDVVADIVEIIQCLPDGDLDLLEKYQPGSFDWSEEIP